ncbi:hypothetical protein GCM10010106_42850 [Thermopolyspora flexuosa]|uniref:Uncharacterized protein DUF4328 n=1 Tax=Thermopolyspora flexuosa TaxID=103836 RepID=A0A543IV09_9ACTN|nr:DUF4328 domain-containing protein [Thermopolyspora flexuosa]TQM74391.1 uncharacterized protein DUF4328 [Thermopolyspora flexuosa]GGM90722.1 hypothetical protein GCM10010106_42850 [Thermopolyspora flexuosa]
MRATLSSNGSSTGFASGSFTGLSARLAAWLPGRRATWSSAGRYAVRVYVALAVLVLAMAALVIFEETRGGPLAARIAAIDGDPRAPGAEEITGELTAFALLVLAVAVAWAAAAVTYLRWLGQMRRSALRAWLIPIVNLVAPPFALHAAWREADPPAGRRHRPVLLVAWWLSWLAALATVTISLVAGDDGLTGLGPAAVTVTALAAALCAATVREVTRAGVAPRRRPVARIAAAPLAAPVAPPSTVPGNGGPVAGG